MGLRETLRSGACLGLTAIWLQLSTAPASAGPTVQPVDGLIVVDVAGKRVGRVITYGGDGLPDLAVVALRVDGTLLVLAVEQHGWSPVGLNLIGEPIFESSDCTGTPFTRGQFSISPTLIPSYLLSNTAPHQVVFLPAGEPRSVLANSSWG